MPSPVRPSKPSPSRGAPTTMSFPEAMQAVVDGQRVSRQAWGDSSVYVFRSVVASKDGASAGGYLAHRTADGKVDAIIIPEVDLDATDWIVVHEQ